MSTASLHAIPGALHGERLASHSLPAVPHCGMLHTFASMLTSAGCSRGPNSRRHAAGSAASAGSLLQRRSFITRGAASPSCRAMGVPGWPGLPRAREASQIAARVDPPDERHQLPPPPPPSIAASSRSSSLARPMRRCHRGRGWCAAPAAALSRDANRAPCCCCCCCCGALLELCGDRHSAGGGRRAVEW